MSCRCLLFGVEAIPLVAAHRLTPKEAAKLPCGLKLGDMRFKWLSLQALKKVSN